MNKTNLNMLFVDLLPSYAFIATIEPMTKKEFIKAVIRTYSKSNTRNNIFIAAIERSTFDTIRLSNDRSAILFNQ